MMTTSFSNLQSFLAMGGYGSYVWSAYGIVVLVGVWQVLRQMVRVNKMKKLNVWNGGKVK
ncbi:MAG: hypothetical protein K0Q74_354 [Gammaproteobacteria bacterium]|jgi:heme exporter protein CcmD|nr:hypothetical protein [Gammaproteobacteria bacterium]